MPITALFAGLLAPLFLLLSIRVIGMRRTARIGIGDGGNTHLVRRMRVHANFAEYVPLTLVLMALAESLHAPAASLYAAGGCLLVGRLMHAFGVSQSNEKLPLRVGGMLLTFAAIVIAAASCLMLTAMR